MENGIIVGFEVGWKVGRGWDEQKWLEGQLDDLDKGLIKAE